MDYSVGVFEVAQIQATLHGCNVSRIYPLVSRTQQSTPLCLDQPRRCWRTCGVFTFGSSRNQHSQGYLRIWA
jgi:hypothetical protein